MKTRASILFVSALTMIGYSALSQQITDIHAAFKSAYTEWTEYVRTNIPSNIMMRSTIPSSLFYDNKPFRKLLALGVSAVPEIMEKCHDDRRLLEALRRLTKWEYHTIRTGKTPETYTWNIEEFPQIKQKGGPPDGLDVWRYWWESGRKETASRFNTAYGNWKTQREAGKEFEAQSERRRIFGLGIAALPAMMVKVEKGDADVIPLISELTDGATKADFKPAECLDWWAKNKQIWLLPTNNENP